MPLNVKPGVVADSNSVHVMQGYGEVIRFAQLWGYLADLIADVTGSNVPPSVSDGIV